jgi:hypothetical protein
VISATLHRHASSSANRLITGDTSTDARELSRDPNLRIVSQPVRAEEFLGIVRDLFAA